MECLMGRTAFQILRDKFSGPPELKLYNPLALTNGQLVRLNIIDLNDMMFKVTGVRQYDRLMGGNHYQFVDYDVHGADKNFRIRMIPMSNPDLASGLTHDIILLSLYYECSYNDAEGLRDALEISNSTGEFEIDWNGITKYYRINDTVRGNYDASVKCVLQEHNDDYDVSYWDYHTQLVDEVNQPIVRYLFIEVDTDGMYQLWVGDKIDPLQLSVN